MGVSYSANRNSLVFKRVRQSCARASCRSIAGANRHVIGSDRLDSAGAARQVATSLALGRRASANRKASSAGSGSRPDIRSTRTAKWLACSARKASLIMKSDCNGRADEFRFTQFVATSG